jgi:hypothetical protein
MPGTEHRARGQGKNPDGDAREAPRVATAAAERVVTTRPGKYRTII